jgi:hypothetical protein
MAQQPGQKTFSSAEEATNAFFTAVQSNDEKVMLDILGPDGRQIVTSGDEIEDANGRADLVQRYQEMHRLVEEPDGTTTLYIGSKNWPTPIPVVNKGNSWRRKRNTTPHSRTSMPRKSSVMKGNATVPRARSGRWWHQPLRRAMPKAETALRPLTAVTITTS